MILNKSNSITIDDCMEVLSCTRSYVYKMIRRNELSVLEDCYPLRVTFSSIKEKLSRLYPWLVEHSWTSISYHLAQKAQHQY